MERIYFMKWSGAASVAFALHVVFVYVLLISGPPYRYHGVSGAAPAAGITLLAQPRCAPALARRNVDRKPASYAAAPLS
jgi:hypothetical protein